MYIGFFLLFLFIYLPVHIVNLIGQIFMACRTLIIVNFTSIFDDLLCILYGFNPKRLGTKYSLTALILVCLYGPVIQVSYEPSCIHC